MALDGQIFHPSEKLHWLGYWFVPNLASSAHFSRRLALSQAAFFSVRRLSDAGKGVSPHLCHRLAYCLMFPILSYGADLFTPTKGLLNKMEVHWRQVQRWVTNCFRSTPVPILAAESCLPPLTVLLPHKRRMAALRLISSPTLYQPRFGPSLQVFPHSTQGQGAGLLPGPVHTPGSQRHATELKDPAPLPPGAHPSPCGRTSAFHPSPP